MSYGHRSVYAHSVRNSRVSRYYNSSDRNKIIKERKKIKDDSKANNSSYDKRLASAYITNNTSLYGSKKTNLQSVMNSINSININNAFGRNENNALTSLVDDIDQLNKACDKLTSKGINSIFIENKKVITKDKEGKEQVTYEYDKEAIISGIRKYVNKYNELIEDSKKSANSKDVSNYIYYLTKATNNSKFTLEDIGIQLDSNKGTLSIVDEQKLTNSDVKTLKSVFADEKSYGQNAKIRINNLSQVASGEMMAKKNNWYGYGI